MGKRFASRCQLGQHRPCTCGKTNKGAQARREERYCLGHNLRNRFLPGCDRALFDKEVAIPLAPSSWPKDDVVKEINCMTAAVPVRVVLHDLMEPDVYSGAESYPTIELVYLHGCKELHAFAESESSTQITIGGKLCRVALNPVSYTHLTLPTILLV